MSASKLHHFSPVLANKYWAQNDRYVCYYRDVHKCRVSKTDKGRKQWGRRRKLYRQVVEKALGEKLETPVAKIYEGFLVGRSPDARARLKWAQFLRSQFVRTPSFMRYEKVAKHVTGNDDEPENDRVGCEHCLDLRSLVGRDWVVLVAHSDDFFLRTDNPVHLTGFIERPQSVLYYPLTPKWCFAACSMPDEWDPIPEPSALPPEIVAVRLEKGGAHMLNFCFSKAADESVILHPEHDGPIAEAMLTEILGIYPQIPFDLHRPAADEVDNAYESLRQIMSVADGVEYPPYEPTELEPFMDPTSRRRGREQGTRGS